MLFTLPLLQCFYCNCVEIYSPFGKCNIYALLSTYWFHELHKISRVTLSFRCKHRYVALY
uniref:Uncharacterized protein n=1 Tax=Arundo donax TaxID=35708 RepID=A0A0A9DTK8_ARUDO